MQDKEVQEVVVLGAAGFIGRHVSRALSLKGLHVLGLGHGVWQEDEWRAWGLTAWLEADISFEVMERLPLTGVPCSIYHCGGSGSVSYSYGYPLLDFKRTTHSTAEVLEWVRIHGAGRCRVVLVSSAAVYGDQGDTNATENSIRSPISPYGFHKMAAESICDSYSRFFSIPVSIVRLFSVYGEGLRKQLLWDALTKFHNGKSQFFGTGNELRDWIHVDDAARLLVLAGLSSQSTFEIYNGGFEQVTTRDLLTRIGKAYGHHQPIVFNGEINNGNPHRLTSDFSHATRLLDWHPTICLRDGLERYVIWFKNQLISTDTRKPAL